MWKAKKWSQWSGLNRRPTVYETVALFYKLSEQQLRESGDVRAALDPFALKKSIEVKLKKFFTVLGYLNREATKT